MAVHVWDYGICEIWAIWDAICYFVEVFDFVAKKGDIDIPVHRYSRYIGLQLKPGHNNLDKSSSPRDSMETYMDTVAVQLFMPAGMASCVILVVLSSIRVQYTHTSYTVCTTSNTGTQYNNQRNSQQLHSHPWIMDSTRESFAFPGFMLGAEPVRFCVEYIRTVLNKP